MEKLKAELDGLMRRLPDEAALRQRLKNLVSVYPFNEYEYIISTLLAMDVLSLDAYHALRNGYIARERYLPIFQISSPTGFGKTWASSHLRELVPELCDPDSNEYDFKLDDRIHIEVKASRAVDKRSRKPLHEKALASDSNAQFIMNFQQLKPGCCHVFVWIAVWRDLIRYWVLSSHEVETNRHYSSGQHRGNVGEGQLHVRDDNIADFASFEAKSADLVAAIRAAYSRQPGGDSLPAGATPSC